MEQAEIRQPANPIEYSKLTLLLCLIVGFLCVELLFWGSLMLSYALFIMASEGVALWVMHRTKKLTRQDLWWPVTIATLLPLHILTDNFVIIGLNSFLIFLIFNAQLVVISGTAKLKWYSPLFIVELAGTFVTRIFSHIPYAFTFKPTNKNQNVRNILLGALAAIPLLVIVMLLLSSADAVFNHYMNKIFENFHMSTFLWKLVLTVICTLLLFSFLTAMAQKKGIPFIQPKQKKGLPVSAAITFMTGLNIVYIIFCAMQFMYLFGAFTMDLPEGISYTNYARDGFFELATIGIINLIVLLVFITFTKPSPKGNTFFKVTMTLLVITTVTMLASAGMRLVMYSHGFGLTRLRVYTLWFLALELLLILVVLVRIYYMKFSFLKVALAVFVICWLILGYSHSDAMIAKNNVDRYIAGEYVDSNGLQWLSHDADSELIRLYTFDPKPLTEAEISLKDRYEDVKEHLKDWKQWNLSRSRALKELKQIFED